MYRTITQSNNEWKDLLIESDICQQYFAFTEEEKSLIRHALNKNYGWVIVHVRALNSKYKNK